MELAELTTPIAPNFCPGCGDFSIWAAFKKACVESGWDNTNTALVAGVGCHGHMVNFVKITAFGGLHGRDYPLAEGIKYVNKDLNVFVFTGDGDSLAEGGNHFIHACRRNHDINIILHDNAIYGLTTGQTSPRTPCGYKSKSTPDGNMDEPFNPLALAITAGATFVARVYSGDIPKLAEMMIKAQQHRGMSIIDILQPCVTFHKQYTHIFYQKNTYWLGADHDPTNKEMAWKRSLEWTESKIPLGIFYQVEAPTQEDTYPQIKDQPPLVSGVLQKRDVSDQFAALM